MRREFRIAGVVLEVGLEDCWRWTVLRCPLRGLVHQHGAGLLSSDDPRPSLNHRAHLDGGPGYELVDIHPAGTIPFVCLREQLGVEAL
jgi:hypothetical protein